MKQIGARLKEIREAKGWTQDDLADAAGMNRVTIAKYESGRIEPKSASLSKLAAALEVGTDVLLGTEKDEMSEEEREMWELREQVRRDPDRHYLFSLARDASIDDVRQAVAIIDALKNTRR